MTNLCLPILHTELLFVLLVANISKQFWSSRNNRVYVNYYDYYANKDCKLDSIPRNYLGNVYYR